MPRTKEPFEGVFELEYCNMQEYLKDKFDNEDCVKCGKDWRHHKVNLTEVGSNTSNPFNHSGLEPSIICMSDKCKCTQQGNKILFNDCHLHGLSNVDPNDVRLSVR